MKTSRKPQFSEPNQCSLNQCFRFWKVQNHCAFEEKWWINKSVCCTLFFISVLFNSFVFLNGIGKWCVLQFLLACFVLILRFWVLLFSRAWFRVSTTPGNPGNLLEFVWSSWKFLCKMLMIDLIGFQLW